MSIEPHSPSHRGEIADLFIRDAAMLPLRYARPCYTLYALTTTSLRPTRFRDNCAIYNVYYQLTGNKTQFKKIVFLFFNQNICCGYPKEPSSSSQLDGF